MKDDRLYLIHIKEALERIEEYTQDGEEAFFEDRKTQDAVLRNLHTLAESSQRISKDLKKNYSKVDWRIISAFRNVVVHDYLGISLERIWDIVESELPNLVLGAKHSRPALRRLDRRNFGAYRKPSQGFCTRN